MRMRNFEELKQRLRQEPGAAEALAAARLDLERELREYEQRPQEKRDSTDRDED